MASSGRSTTCASILPQKSFCFNTLVSDGLKHAIDDATLDTGPIDSTPRDLLAGLDASCSVAALPEAAISNAISTWPETSPVNWQITSDDAFTNVFGGDSPLTTPSSSRPSSPTSIPRKRTSKQIHNAQKSKRQRRERRQLAREADPEAFRMPQAEVAEKFVINSQPPKRQPEYEVKNIPSASTGWVATRGERDRVYTLPELLEQGFELIKWDGRESRPIVDQNDVVVAVLLGMPTDPTWQQVHDDAFRLLQESIPKCQFDNDDTTHRRGDFAVLNAGISFGGGRDEPGNVTHNHARQEVVDELLRSKSFIRIAGFQSRGFATWMPNIHAKYHSNLLAIMKNDRSLKRNFANSAWAAAALNLGPRTTTTKHRDHANLPHGICGITALGTYDYVEGGHVVLWELGLVIEFPPGSTILLPSAAISHSNTPVGPTELRSSFTQYSAGGLFQYESNGFKTQKKVRARMSKKKKLLIPQLNEARVAEGIALFSTLSELRSKKK